MTFFNPQNPGIGGLDELTDSELSFLQNLVTLSYASGDILYHDGSNLVRLAKGSDTEVLTLASGIPSWAAGGGTGDLLADGSVPLTANWDVGAYTITGTQFISDIADGTAPFVVTSTTVVTNLNASFLEGNAASAFATALGADDNYVTDAEKTVIGNTSGTNTGDNTVCTSGAATTAITADVATTVTITDNESTNEENPIVFVAGADPNGGNLGLETDGTCTYNPSTGKITTTGFVGALTGTATTVSTITGLAPDTATTQATQAAITSAANLVTVGTIGTGTWAATDVGVAHGGTGKSAWTQWLIPYADTTTSFSQIAIGTADQVLTSNGAGAAPTFQDASGGGSMKLFYTNPTMADGESVADTQQLNVNTTMYIGMFTLSLAMTVTQITIDIAGIPATAGTLDIVVYDEAGSSRPISITTAAISADGVVDTAVSSVALSAGNYYLGIVPNTDADMLVRRIRLSTNAAALNDEAGIDPTSGTLTVTASTPPATITPGDITASIFGCFGTVLKGS